MKSMTILEWNIHGSGGYGRDPVPRWIPEETAGAQIIVLTEFCGSRRPDGKLLIRDLEERGYHCAASENSGGNDVLIASCYPIIKSSWEPCCGKDALPENLRAELNCGGSILTVFGVRIKSLDRDPRKYLQRKTAFRWVLDQLRDEKHPVVIAGDFNNNRRATVEETWSLKAMDRMLRDSGYIRSTPAGSSIYEESRGNAPDYEFAYDHFISKDVSISQQEYDRDFTERHPRHYPYGRNFCPPWRPGADRNGVAAPYPDHAILRGVVTLP